MASNLDAPEGIWREGRRPGRRWRRGRPERRLRTAIVGARHQDAQPQARPKQDHSRL